MPFGRDAQNNSIMTGQPAGQETQQPEWMQKFLALSRAGDNRPAGQARPGYENIPNPLLAPLPDAIEGTRRNSATEAAYQRHVDGGVPSETGRQAFAGQRNMPLMEKYVSNQAAIDEVQEDNDKRSQFIESPIDTDEARSQRLGGTVMPEWMRMKVEAMRAASPQGKKQAEMSATSLANIGYENIQRPEWTDVPDVEFGQVANPAAAAYKERLRNSGVDNSAGDIDRAMSGWHHNNQSTILGQTNTAQINAANNANQGMEQYDRVLTDPDARIAALKAAEEKANRSYKFGRDDNGNSIYQLA